MHLSYFCYARRVLSVLRQEIRTHTTNRPGYEHRTKVSIVFICEIAELSSNELYYDPGTRLVPGARHVCARRKKTQPGHLKKSGVHYFMKSREFVIFQSRAEFFTALGLGLGFSNKGLGEKLSLRNLRKCVWIRKVT